MLLFVVLCGSARAEQRAVTLAVGIDGIVVRGTWRARIEVGVPRLRYAASNACIRAISLSRHATTLTIVQSEAPPNGSVPTLYLSVRHLRGVAVSGAVDLMLDDRSGAPLFLDLSGSGTVRARGAVALLRVTTSGSVTADLTPLNATIARVHARQHSRLAIRARRSLTIVALDEARVTYGAPTVHRIVRNAAIATLEPR